MSYNILFKRYLKDERAEETIKLEVEGHTIHIGTGAGNEIQLEGIGIATNHALIERTEDITYWITDLQSSEGTYVNNNRVKDKYKLSDNDKIDIANYTITISIPDEADEIPTILITQKEEDTESETDEDDKDRIKQSIKYVSRYKLSEGIFTKTRLSVLFVSLLIIITVYWIVGKDGTSFSPGELSSAHTQFNDKCDKCHTVAFNIVPDKNCLDCHEDNPHNLNISEDFNFNCVDCHKEHHGMTILANLENNVCTQCHSDLIIKGNKPSKIYERHITDFEKDHPEFAVFVKPTEQNEKPYRIRLSDKNNLSDNTPIKLNHKIHLEPGIDGYDGPENLNCESCHIIDEVGEYFLQINYENNCSRCHTLVFDNVRFINQTVPHENPKIVRDSLQKFYSEYSLQKLVKLGYSTDSIIQWVSQKAGESEDILFRTKCAECHTIIYPKIANELPEIINPNIPIRWFPHGKFDHELHAKNLSLSCESCHMGVLTSESTTDVLLPSINKCIKCHSSKGGAKTECVTCHQYHERKESKIIEGTKTIKDILD